MRGLGLALPSFTTTADIALDCLYVFTEAYASYVIWFLAIGSIILPNVFLFLGTGALRPLFSLPWATYAWRIVITIRGRRPFHEDKHGTYHYFGLAEKVTKWDSPLVALTMLPYILLIKPLLSIALFLFVYVYVFLILPILCLFALALASNLRLAVFPRIMNAIVTFVKELPPILFGVRLEDIDPWDFDERMKRLRKTRGSAIACKWVRGEIPEYEEQGDQIQEAG